jgi:hypothetical protein
MLSTTRHRIGDKPVDDWHAKRALPAAWHHAPDG